MELNIPAKWKTLTDEETQLVSEGYGRQLFRQYHFPTPVDELLEQVDPGSPEEKLYRCIQLISNKLDFIIDQMQPESTDHLRSTADVVEMSGSGLRFICREYLPAGRLLKMDLVVPGSYHHQVELIAEVVRVTRIEDGFITAAKIIDVDEADRESIVKIVFDRQRKALRGSRSDEEESQGDR
jgi:hypothetical protein